MSSFINKMSNITRQYVRRVTEFMPSKKNGLSLLIKHKRLTALIGLFAVFSAALLNMNVAWSISVDGEVLGYAENRDAAEYIIESVEKAAANAAGLKSAVSFNAVASPVITLQNNDEYELQTVILQNVSDIRYLYVISADGVPVCAAENEKVAENAVEALLDSYRTENTVLLEFAETVKIEGGYASGELLYSESQLPKKLETSLTVYMEEVVFKAETVPFDVQYIETAGLYEDETQPVTEGENGFRNAEYKVAYLNGTAVSSELVRSETITNPVPAFVFRGVKERLSEGNYIWPATGVITSGFGYRTGFGSSNHQGLDIAFTDSRDIIAADGGVVIFAESYYGYGNLVQIEHDNGDITYYAHLDSIAVSAGVTVKQGDYLGVMGETGTASGIHLHFEYHPQGVSPIDPREILP